MIKILENIDTWIFKAIWMPIYSIILMAALAVIIAIAKDCGFEKPYNWLIIIAAVAYIADHVVNKGG